MLCRGESTSYKLALQKGGMKAGWGKAQVTNSRYKSRHEMADEAGVSRAGSVFKPLVFSPLKNNQKFFTKYLE